VLLFVGAESPRTARVDVEGGCEFVWSDTGVHAYATKRLLQQLAVDAARSVGPASPPPPSPPPSPPASASAQEIPRVGSQALVTLKSGVTVACPDLLHGDPGAIGFRGDVSVSLPSATTVFRAVVRCRVVTRDIAGLGQWQVEFAEVSYGNPTELVAQLRTPDQPATGACGMSSQYGYPWFALVESDGRVDRPAMPSQGCGPMPSAVAALDRLSFNVVDAVRIRVAVTR
jgi:hypothetical protein